MISYSCSIRSDTASIASHCCGITGIAGAYSDPDKTCTYSAADTDEFERCVNHYEHLYAWTCLGSDGSHCEGQAGAKVCTAKDGTMQDNPQGSLHNGSRRKGASAALLFMALIAVFAA